MQMTAGRAYEISKASRLSVHKGNVYEFIPALSTHRTFDTDHLADQVVSSSRIQTSLT